MLHDGEPIRGVNQALGFVFQQDAVFPWLTVEQNVEYGPKSRGVPKAERERLVAHWCESVGLSALSQGLSEASSRAACASASISRAPTPTPPTCC